MSLPRHEPEDEPHILAVVPERRRDAVALTIGLITFLGGVGLIVATFVIAQAMFSVPADEAIGIKKGETLDLNGVVGAGLFIVMKVLLLVVMAGIGSAIATRGIRLYVQGGSLEVTRKPKRR
jgi:hypothetical protein